MFGIFTGVIANTALVVLGTALGCAFKGEKLKNIGERVFQGFGLFTVVLGVSGAIGLEHPLFMLASLIIGIAAGELADLDDKFNRLGEALRKRFGKEGETGCELGAGCGIVTVLLGLRREFARIWAVEIGRPSLR